MTILKDARPPINTSVDFAKIPTLLASQRRWAPWRPVWNPGREKWDKIPLNGLSTAKPERWGPLATAQAQASATTGVGFVMTGVQGLVGIDLDHCVIGGVVADWAQAVVDQLQSYTEISPSGTGLHIFASGSVDEDWANHCVLVVQGIRQGIEVYGGHEVRFLTITGHHLAGTPDQVQPAPSGVLDDLDRTYRAHRVEKANPAGDMPELIDELALPELPAVVAPHALGFLANGAPDGVDGSKVLWATAVALRSAGLSAADVFSHLVANPHAMEIALRHRPRGGYEGALAYLWKHHAGKAQPRALVASADEFDDCSPVVGVDPEPPPAFVRNKLGQVEATLGNVLKALRRPDVCQARIGHDKFLDELMICPADSDQWRPYTDSDGVALREGLTIRHGFKEIGRELMRDAVLKVSDEFAFDSAKQWLASLAAHDGAPRCETFLADYLGCEDTPYTRAVSLYLWTALAGRVLEPGCRADMVPVLVGTQGVGKTTTVRALSPDPEMFTEINLAQRDDNLARTLRGKLVAELGELRGLAGRDAEDIKAWISRTHEEWVPKYREHKTRFPRRLVMVGTTNQDEFLADTTGNRRWLPVNVGACDAAAVARDRDLLWSEARDLFKAGGVQWQQAEALAGQVHEDYAVQDSWQAAVEAWLAAPGMGDEPPPGQRRFVRLADALVEALNFNQRDIQRRDELRMGNVLRALGYERKKVWDGTRRKVWGYVPPLGPFQK